MSNLARRLDRIEKPCVRMTAFIEVPTYWNEPRRKEGIAELIEDLADPVDTFQTKSNAITEARVCLIADIREFFQEVALGSCRIGVAGVAKHEAQAETEQAR